jgi:hypothetical protein
VSDSKRQQFLQANSHLWGKIDPIDGIAYRPPVEPAKELPQQHDPKNRGIYDEPDRSGLVVRVRWCGRLHYLGVYPTIKRAREVRDAFDRDREENFTCPHCGEMWDDGEERPMCCLFLLAVQAAVQAELAGV